MIATLKAEVKIRALDFRNLARLIDTPEFTEALRLDPDNIFIKFALVNGNFAEIKEWIEDTLVTEVGEMSMRQLRKRAGILGIPRYTIHSKDELIVRIIREQDAREAKKSIGGMSLPG